MFDAIASFSPPQRLALSYLKPQLRPLLTLLLAVDSKMADIHGNLNEVLMAQIRLAWWRDTINSDIKPKGEPLVAMIDEVQHQFPHVNITQSLIDMIDGWEHLIVADDVMNDDELSQYAYKRGGTIFGLIALECGQEDLSSQYKRLGAIWALSSLYIPATSQSITAKQIAKAEVLAIELKKLSRQNRCLSILSYPAVHALSSKSDKVIRHEGFSFGLSYIWHAISGRWGMKFK